ncbi:MAG: T9SS type A sorting domain-containing protein [Bacteroidales bacterium]|nr:T9SS type A sorting domain-containing protein [Bacteroidales bacterium]
MKITVLLVLMSFLVFQLSAQKPIMYDSLIHYDTTNGMIIQSPITFVMNDSADREYFMIDTTQSNNIWQYAKVNKPGFAQLNTIALTTDSVNNYSKNDTSSFIFKIIFNTNTGGFAYFGSLGITLHHKYQTDSLNDGLMFEFYDFYSHKWSSYFNVISSNTYNFLVLNRDSTYNWGGYYPASPLSGNSILFHNSRLAFGEPGVKATVDSVLLRFTFVSDSINTNKAGWLIDEIMIEANNFRTGSVRECKLASDSYLSYVDDNQLVINSLLQENRQADFVLFDMLGREIIINEVHYGINTFNLSNLPAGYYIVKVKNQAGVYTKKIFIGK